MKAIDGDSIHLLSNYQLYSSKNWQFRYQPATCEDRRPCTVLGLSPYTIVTHPVSPICRKSSREVGGRGERWEAPDHPQGVLTENWGETELNHSVMLLKATANDRRHLAFCNDEFSGP
ncbi:hypothetical protein TNCV_2775681 [Trichonephila clavipes]|nr:hypothetical protein TNCV_2775681 [Trichonephila clavipes]